MEKEKKKGAVTSVGMSSSRLLVAFAAALMAHTAGALECLSTSTSGEIITEGGFPVAGQSSWPPMQTSMVTCAASVTQVPTLEATQGQIFSQSPTEAIRFWWHLYGS